MKCLDFATFALQSLDVAWQRTNHTLLLYKILFEFIVYHCGLSMQKVMTSQNLKYLFHKDLCCQPANIRSRYLNRSFRFSLMANLDLLLPQLQRFGVCCTYDWSLKIFSSFFLKVLQAILKWHPIQKIYQMINCLIEFDEINDLSLLWIVYYKQLMCLLSLNLYRLTN